MGEAFSCLFVLSLVSAKTPIRKIAKIRSDFSAECERVNKTSTHIKMNDL